MTSILLGLLGLGFVALGLWFLRSRALIRRDGVWSKGFVESSFTLGEGQERRHFHRVLLETGETVDVEGLFARPEGKHVRILHYTDMRSIDDDEVKAVFSAWPAIVGGTFFIILGSVVILTAIISQF